MKRFLLFLAVSVCLVPHAGKAQTATLSVHVTDYCTGADVEGFPVYFTGMSFPTTLYTGPTGLQHYIANASTPSVTANYTTTAYDVLSGPPNTVYYTGADINANWRVARKVTGSFNVNGLTQTGTPPVIYNCGTLVMGLNESHVGNVSSFDIRVSKGTWNGSAFSETFAQTASVSGGTLGSYDLASNFSSFLSGYTGYVRVRLAMNGVSCTGYSPSPYVINQVFQIRNETAPSAPADVQVNGIVGSPGQTPPLPIPLLTFCGTSNTMLVESSGSTGNVTGYTVGVVKMYIQIVGGVPNLYVPDYYAPAPVSVTAAQLATPGFDLGSAFSSYLSGYNGYLMVNVAATGPCGTSFTQQTFEVYRRSAISNPGFTLNGSSQATSTSTPPVIWLCSNTDLNLLGNQSGVVDQYDVTVERGTWNGSAFTIGTGNVPVTASNLTAFSGGFPDVNLSTLASVGASLSGLQNEYIRVTLTFHGACNGTNPESIQVFKVLNAQLLANFTLKAPGGCSPDQVRHLTTSFATQPTITSSGSVITNCSAVPNGYLGAFQCGISNYTAGNELTVNGYAVSVDEVSPGSANRFSVSVPSGTIPASLPFNDASNGFWFLFNYNTIKNSSVFKVSATVATTECGNVTTTSYFKILDGGSSGSGFRRIKPDEYEAALKVYPSHTADALHFDWSSAKGSDQAVVITVLDARGAQVLRISGKENKGANKFDLDVSALPQGLYIYKVQYGGKNESGTFEKL